MEEPNLFLICLNAFVAVIGLLAALAGTLRGLLELFPEQPGATAPSPRIDIRPATAIAPPPRATPWQPWTDTAIAVAIWSEEDCQKAADKVGFPMIIKPTSGAGSMGVYKVLTRAHTFVAHQESARIQLDVPGLLADPRCRTLMFGSIKQSGEAFNIKTRFKLLFPERMQQKV